MNLKYKAIMSDKFMTGTTQNMKDIKLALLPKAKTYLQKIPSYL